MDILDLTPPQLEWRIYKGDTSTFNIIVVDEADTAIDISGYTFEAILKNNEMVEIVPLDISVIGNSISLSLPTEAVLTARNYFDLQGTWEGKVTTFLRGTVFSEGDVTN